MSLAAPYQEHYYVADGSTTSFAFGQSFTALNEIDVKCIIYFEDGTNCVPVFNVNMTTGFINIVSLTKPDGTLLTVPPAGSIVRVFRKTPEAQNVTASQLQNYTAKQLERVFDSLVAMIQEISYSDIHKTVRLTETQRDIAIDYLPDDKDQAVIYWDVEERKLMPAGFGQNQVVKSDGVEWLVYNQSEGKVYFIPRQGGNPIPIGKATIHNDLSGRNAPDCHPESAITGLREHLQELRDKDSEIEEDVQIALNRSQEAKDTADEAKETAEHAQTIAGQAKDIAEDAKETAEGIEDIAQEAKDTADEAKEIAQDAKDIAEGVEDIAQEALDKVTQEITDREDADEDLQDQIDSLSGRGRFLALWNCATGLAESNPPESPYLYKAGDYFVVGTVSSADPAVNYKPDGSSYTTGVASTTVETNEVSVNDTYFYDGTVWKLQSNAQKEVSFSALAGSPYDNTNLSNALNAKANASALTAHTSNTNNPHEVTKAQVGLGNVDNTSDLNKPISTATQTALNSKQDVISDLSTIRSGAALGATAVQPADLATVATTGDYDDLSNKPTIPTVNNPIITITQGGVTKGSFTLNQATDDTIALDAGGGGGAVDSVNGKTGVVVLTATDVGALPDSTVIPDAQIQSDWNQADNTKVDFIKNKPTIPAAQVNSDWNANSGVAQILNKPTLATVATSGSYTDLSNKPTIPTVNNPTITITQGGVTKGSFTLNQATGDTISLDAGGGSSYTAGDGIDITNDVISVDDLDCGTM